MTSSVPATGSGWRLDLALPRAALLAHGDYVVRIGEDGTGGSWLGRVALTRWAGDPVEDRDGLFLYLRDLDTGAFWSAGRQPVPAAPERYAAAWRPGCFEIARTDHEVAARFVTCVAGDAPLELRRLELVNRSARRRRIEVTSYAEIVLQEGAAHEAHPEFSRLFVQTEHLPEHGALLAHRRPRDPHERRPWLLHAVLEPGPLEHETDRARFVGRGGSLADPLALRLPGPLSGSTGSVLDPIVSLRRVLHLEPGGAARVTFVLGAGKDRESALALGGRLSEVRMESVLEEAAARDHAARERHGIDEEGAAVLHAFAAALMSGRAWGASRLPEAPGGDAPTAVNGRRDGVVAATGAAGAEARVEAAPREALLHDNGWGGFAADGSEYVIRLRHEGGRLRLPPRPWINVIANERFGCIVSETGAGATWSANSREQRLTPWSNDPLVDPHGEALYVRDEADGALWSPLPGPCPGPADYEVRHGFGYTVCRHACHGLEHETTVFVTRDEPLKVVRLRLTNRGGPRRLALYAYQRLVLGSGLQAVARRVTTVIDGERGVLLAMGPGDDDWGTRVALAACVGADPEGVSFGCDRATFLGPGGAAGRPAAPRAGGPLDGRAGAGREPCFATRVPVTLGRGETLECSFLLGEAEDRDAALARVERYRRPGAVERALAGARGFWRELFSGVRIETPSSALDLMVNGWLAYQGLSCRMWGRTALYQSGGAFGYRDQLQDAAAIAWLDPRLTREQLLLHAAHQFVEGDVLHWWHAPLERGLRTRFVDDLLWLPYLTADYVRRTGDAAVLDARAPYVSARPLAPGEDEAYLAPEPEGEGDLYEHCCRAIDRSLEVGPHGLPRFGGGDWNDGMNRVGREGRGESVWMAFFLDHVLAGFAPLCERRGDAARARRYREQQRCVRAAVERHAWDGGWYLRGYYDDGATLGSSKDDECRIDALVQAWAVISGAADPTRARAAMDAVEERLVQEGDGLIRLLWPSFDRTPRDPGYIKGYVPGVRENGGQYTHAAMWVVRALAELGRRDRALPLLEMLTPVRRAATPEDVARYQVEPYVVAADVYGEPPHVGRGGWTWYTGSAGWMLRVALESVLGITVEDGTTLRIRPCIPAEWPGFTVTLRLPAPGARVAIRAVQRLGGSGRVVEARLDGTPVAIEADGVRVAIPGGGDHAVELVLG